MTTVQNDYKISEKRFNQKALAFIENLAEDLALKHPDSRFKSRFVSGRGDSLARYLGVIQIGPKRGILGRRKRKKLVEIRCSDYSNHPHPIQVTCSNATIESRVVQGFEKIGKEEGGNEVLLYRRGYETPAA